MLTNKKSIFFLLMLVFFNKSVFSQILWHPNENLFSWSHDKTVDFYLVRENTTQQTFELSENNNLGHSDLITSTSWHPSGFYFASSSKDNTIKIWSWQDYELHHVQTINSCVQINFIAWDKTGDYLIINHLTAVELWQFSNEQAFFLQNICVSPLERETNHSESCLDKNEGILFYINEQKANLYGLDGEKYGSLECNKVSPNPNKKSFIAVGNKKISLYSYNKKKRKHVKSISLKKDPLAIAWNFNGDLFSYLGNGKLNTYRLNESNFFLLTSVSFNAKIQDFSFSPYENWVLIIYENKIHFENLSTFINTQQIKKEIFLPVEVIKEETSKKNSPLVSLKRYLSRSASPLRKATPPLKTAAISSPSLPAQHNVAKQTPIHTPQYIFENLNDQLKEKQSQSICKGCGEVGCYKYLSCGHIICQDCYDNLIDCPECGRRVVHRVKARFTRTE